MASNNKGKAPALLSLDGKTYCPPLPAKNAQIDFIFGGKYTFMCHILVPYTNKFCTRPSMPIILSGESFKGALNELLTRPMAFALILMPFVNENRDETTSVQPCLATCSVTSSTITQLIFCLRMCSAFFHIGSIQIARPNLVQSLRQKSRWEWQSLWYGRWLHLGMLISSKIPFRVI